MVERFDTIEPLRRLIGTHFRGRYEELHVLRKHLHREEGSKRVLKISGIGGSGKSALLGKLLLELEQSDERPSPWVYLDFDHPEVQPSNPARLIELIARRLGLLYVGHPSSRFFYEIESASAGDPMESFRLGLPRGAPPSELIQALDRVIRRLQMEPSLLIVFDTFEQAQMQGRAVTSQLTETIEQILSALPYAQIVLSGRAVIEAFPDSTRIELGDLDNESADSALEALGIKEQSFRARITRAIGTNPLSLTLAAAAIKSGQLTQDDVEVFIAGASGLEIQGRLYTRILGHISDGEVRRLAHPGLIVRRMTPGVIRNVLAKVCEINPDDAERLFERLPDHVALFEHDDAAPDEKGALRHRQDIREIMIQLMMRDPIWMDHLSEIHTKAIEHYQGRPYAITRAEELYHRLMRDDELEELDALWSQDLAASLGRSWLEPFPERARAWLALRLGRGDLRAPEELRHADWEFYALRETLSHLRAGETDRALSVLAQRSERVPGSPLVPLEVDVLRRLERPMEALAVCRAGLARAQSAEKLQSVLVLHLRAAEIGLDLMDNELLQHHAGQARRIANALQSPLDELRALQVLARGELMDPKLFGDSKQERLLDLERAFAQVQPEMLLQAPDIAERMVKSLRLFSKNVLMKIATTFGNHPDQTLIRADAFLLAELLTDVERKNGGVALLSNLAAAVGLSKTNPNSEEIASNTIRFSRLGDALTAVLDAYGDDDRILTNTANLFL
ncbi:AAA family ATPase [Bradyrhizobium sp. S3.5.5]|uniref:AAA family ATPase n=1 Tax=Bradyrhizobium sp. S3.5.5 TaxID=3156430 RepID=UPI00339860F5